MRASDRDPLETFSTNIQGTANLLAARYTEMISDRLALGTDSLVIEVAANDSDLLRNLVKAGIPRLGIEPTAATAAAAEAQGVPILRQFFGTALGRELAEQQRAGRRIAGYGAAAKGNTLLNDAGVKPDLLPDVCDAAPAKQGKYLPGSHIPIRPPAALRDDPPDEVLILPWNIAEEVKAQLAYLAQRSTRFVTAVPTLAIS